MPVTFNSAKPVEAFTSETTSFYAKDLKVTVPPPTAAASPAVDAAYQQNITDKTTAFTTSLTAVKKSYEDEIKVIIQDSQLASSRLEENQDFKFAIDPRTLPGLPASNYYDKMREEQDKCIVKVLAVQKSQFEADLAKIRTAQQKEKIAFETAYDKLNQDLSALPEPATVGSPKLSPAEKEKQLKAKKDDFEAHQKSQLASLIEMYEKRQTAFLSRSDNAAIQMDFLLKIGLAETKAENVKAAGDILLANSMTGSNENGKLNFHEKETVQYYSTPHSEVSKRFNDAVLKTLPSVSIPGTFHVKKYPSAKAMNQLKNSVLHTGADFSITIDKDQKDPSQINVTVTFDETKTLSFTDRMKAWSVAIHKLTEAKCTRFDISKTIETFIMPSKNEDFYVAKVNALVRELYLMNPDSPLFQLPQFPEYADPNHPTPEERQKRKEFQKKWKLTDPNPAEELKKEKAFKQKWTFSPADPHHLTAEEKKKYENLQKECAFVQLMNAPTNTLIQQEARAALTKQIYLHCPKAVNIDFGYVRPEEQSRLNLIYQNQKNHKSAVEQDLGFSGIARGVEGNKYTTGNALDIEIGRRGNTGNAPPPNVAEPLNIGIEGGAPRP